MNTRLKQIISLVAIYPLVAGVFAVPTAANADWTDIFGYGSQSQNYSYDQNSVHSQSTGDISMAKRVRRVNQDENFHETTVVRSGTLVEIRIQVENETNGPITAIVTDTLGGSVVYKPNSLLVNGLSSAPGLTSGGLRLNIPADSTSTITYQMYVCSGSDYAIRANAYSPGIGSATDAIIIRNEYTNYTNTYNNEVYTCMNQLQSSHVTPINYSNTGYSNPNPFGSWTGVNNGGAIANIVNNPFGDWTGVNNATTTNSSNPFAGWTGVNNSGSQNSTIHNPFGDWTGVNNSNTSSQNYGDPFGTWTGVNNGGSINSTINNPFGDWTGVNNGSTNYDSRGYSTSSSNGEQPAPYNKRPTTVADADIPRTPTYFVAPTTGVSKTAPLWFAGLLTVGFITFRNRKFLFN